MIRGLKRYLSVAFGWALPEPSQGPNPSSGEPLAPPTEPLAAIKRDPGPPPPAAGMRICIDLGTSSSAVTWALDHNHHRFAVFGFDDGGAERRTIGSSVLWIDESNEGLEKLIMGAENYDAVLMQIGGSPSITRSFKRMIFDYEMVPESLRARSRQRLRAMFRELLLLALVPSRSATVAALKQKGSNVDRWTAKGGFALNAAALTLAVAGGIEVCLCIPNSFGSQPISISVEALNGALEDLRRYEGLEGMGVARVRLIREAEAIAWASINTVREHGRVLIIDIGAGTTDVALVENRDNLPRLRMRTGIPFGGDDVDQILLVLATEAVLEEQQAAAQAGGAAAPVDVVKLADTTAAWRQRLQEDARQYKERWSSAREPQDATAPYLINSTDPDTAYVEQTRSVVAPHRSRHYQLFLQYVLAATCAPLLEMLREEGLAVGAVILSGSSSLLPEIAHTVQGLLASVRMTDARVVRISDRLQTYHAFAGTTPVRQAKLACAWGAAESAMDWGRSDDIRTYVPETIRVLHNDRDYALFEAGAIVAGGELTKYIHLNRHTGHRLQFYRYFCVLSASIEERHRTSNWVRRMIHRTALQQGMTGLGVRLTLSNEAPYFEESLSTWYETHASPKQIRQYDLDTPYQPMDGSEPNPVTDLPMNWAWPT